MSSKSITIIYSSQNAIAEIDQAISFLISVRELCDHHTILANEAEIELRLKEMSIELSNLEATSLKYEGHIFFKRIVIDDKEIGFEIRATGEYIQIQEGTFWLVCINPKTSNIHYVRLKDDLELDSAWLRGARVEDYSVIAQGEIERQLASDADAFLQEAIDEGWYWNID